MVLWASASSIDMLPTQGWIQRAKRFSYLLGLSRLRHFEIDEMATGGGTHLTLRLLNEQRFAHSHKGGAGLTRDSGNVGSNESTVGSGGDSGVHKANS